MNADKLAKALDELPAAYDLLPLFMLPGSRPDMDAPQPSGGHNTRSLLVMAALDLMDVRRKPDADPTRQDFERDRELRIWLDGSDRQVTEPGRRRQGVLPTLSSWVRLVDGELWDEDLKHAAPADTPTVAGECSWLRSHIGWIGEQQWLDEITQDVTGMLRDIREVTGEDDKLEGHMFCTVNNGCGWPVQKVLVTNETTGKEDHYYKCSGCPRSWSRLEVWRLGKQKEPKPIVECAELAGVSEKTLRRYKDKGFLKVERRQGKTELFDLDAVMRLTMNSRYRQTSAA